MNKLFYLIILFILTGLFSCKSKQESAEVRSLAISGISPTGTYLTSDNEGNLVLCWTAKNPVDSLYRLQYAIYDSETNSFNTPTIVTPSAGCSISAESMAKVAFKKDGTVIAVFAKRFENEKNPYAGAIYYSESNNHGKNWSEARFLHSDTSHTYGRSFFDITTLKDGEIAAVWLDGRFGKQQKGSALFFSKTSAGKGFEKDSCLNKSTCECCRTDLLCDTEGNLHVAYRSICFPPALLGKQVRDMVYIKSTDNGKSFSKEIAISKDNWQIEGCPHSGPSLAVNKSRANVIWFTAAKNNPGLFYSQTLNNGEFANRIAVSVNGRHPQLTNFGSNRLAVVYEEETSATTHHEEHSHSHGGMSHGQTPAGASKISLKLLGEEKESIDVSDGKYTDHHAVVSPLKDGILVAWTREDNGKSSICYSELKL